MRESKFFLPLCDQTINKREFIYCSFSDAEGIISGSIELKTRRYTRTAYSTMLVNNADFIRKIVSLSIHTYKYYMSIFVFITNKYYISRPVKKHIQFTKIFFNYVFIWMRVYLYLCYFFSPNNFQHSHPIWPTYDKEKISTTNLYIHIYKLDKNMKYLTTHFFHFAFVHLRDEYVFVYYDVLSYTIIRA